MKRGLVLAILLLATACSTQRREATPDMSDSDLASLFQDMSTNTGLSLDPSATVFLYHSGSMPGKPPSSVISAPDISLFDDGAPAQGISTFDDDLLRADAVLVDSMDSNGRTFTLMMAFTHAGDPNSAGDPNADPNANPTVQTNISYFSASTDPNDPNAFQFDHGVFSAQVTATDGSIYTLYSTDLSVQYSDMLGDAVKLDIYDQDGYFVGQVSTMAAYDFTDVMAALSSGNSGDPNGSNGGTDPNSSFTGDPGSVPVTDPTIPTTGP